VSFTLTALAYFWRETPLPSLVGLASPEKSDLQVCKLLASSRSSSSGRDGAQTRLVARLPQKELELSGFGGTTKSGAIFRDWLKPVSVVAFALLEH
jgi:hypothetical protein